MPIAGVSVMHRRGQRTISLGRNFRRLSQIRFPLLNGNGRCDRDVRSQNSFTSHIEFR